MREMNDRVVIITMVDGTVFRGHTNIGGSRRVSDYFNKCDGPFIVLFNATKGTSTEREIYFLNKSQVLWIKPEEDRAIGTQPGEPPEIAIDSEEE